MNSVNSGVLKTRGTMLIARDSKSGLTAVREGWPETVKIEMIRDKFVFGIQDDYLKECLMRK